MSKADKTILVIGTFDTKSDELKYLISCIEKQGGQTLTMDVSVLGDTGEKVSLSKHAVAASAGSTIDQVANSGDENSAMQIMADGAVKLVRQLYADGKFDGLIALGGSMGTDLALDCARALPMGVPKYIISTISFSPIIPADRLAPDIQMILWAGGLYGLNSICRSSLSQAAGAVLGAARAVERPAGDRPLIGMMSLGSSCLSFMKTLKPALEERGYEVAIFHATGMGGMAFEGLAAAGAFAAVMDFATPELGNLMVGSIINGGRDRLLSAGRAGIPQLFSPGSADLIDFAAWQAVPARFVGRPYHAHNRLFASAALTPEERRQLAIEISTRLGEAKAPVHVILTSRGIEEWDREGQPANDPEGLEAFLDEMRSAIKPPIELTEIDCHINDPEFCAEVLKIFDGWVESGIVTRGKK